MAKNEFCICGHYHCAHATILEFCVVPGCWCECFTEAGKISAYIVKPSNSQVISDEMTLSSIEDKEKDAHFQRVGEIYGIPIYSIRIEQLIQDSFCKSNDSPTVTS